MITGVITVLNNLNTLIVNVSLSNNGGEFLFIPSFGFGNKLLHCMFFDLVLSLNIRFSWTSY